MKFQTSFINYFIVKAKFKLKHFINNKFGIDA